MKRIVINLFFLSPAISSFAQFPTNVLIGYWQNWDSKIAPYVSLDSINPAYNVIMVSFAIPASVTDMTMAFKPLVENEETIKLQIKRLQNANKKIFLSIGGGNAFISLMSPEDKDKFSASISTIIEEYNFDGIDIDIEKGESLKVTENTSIRKPKDKPLLYLIAGIRDILNNYKSKRGRKLLLSMAPMIENTLCGYTHYGGYKGSYLPIIEALRDDIDLLHVQLYNSLPRKALDGNIYTAGTPDFLVSMTEMLIKGFIGPGGKFKGIPSNKISILLKACDYSSKEGNGFLQNDQVKRAIKYLISGQAPPAFYQLQNRNGYPEITKISTWSINWDEATTCGNRGDFVSLYKSIFNNK